MKTLLLVATTLIAANGNLSEEKIVANVEKQFADVKTISADFSQTFYDATLAESEKSTGTVRIKKPLKMRWEYNKPYEQTLLSDGKKIYFYFPSDRQVLVEDIGNIIDSRSPALFLAGGYALKDLFNIKLENRSEKDEKGGKVTLILTPKESSISATKILLTVDEKSWNISSFSIFDWTGNRTDIEFIDTKINGIVGSEEFSFKPPAGVEIIQMPKAELGVNK